MKFISSKEAAQKWGITERRVQYLCKNEKIDGAFRLGWAWAIPDNAEKPPDGRQKVKEI